MAIDIMLPYWGRADHAIEAVESIRAQSSTAWRLVIIDDAYPEPEFREWVASLADARIEYVRNPENLGIARNFQRSIDLARADHLVIMGCDDVMLPEYIEHLERMIAADPDAVMYHAGTEIIDADGRVVRTLTDTAKAHYRPAAPTQLSLGGQELAVSVLRGNWMNFPAVVWRRDAIASVGFDDRFSVVQDLELVLSLAERGGHLALEDTLVFRYRRHASSVSSWRGVEGSRFSEEGRYFAEVAERHARLGWQRSARVARRHWSSRVNAAATLPKAIRARDRRATASLLRHVFR